MALRANQPVTAPALSTASGAIPPSISAEIVLAQLAAGTTCRVVPPFKRHLHNSGEIDAIRQAVVSLSSINPDLAIFRRSYIEFRPTRQSPRQHPAPVSTSTCLSAPSTWSRSFGMPRLPAPKELREKTTRQLSAQSATVAQPSLICDPLFPPVAPEQYQPHAHAAKSSAARRPKSLGLPSPHVLYN